MKYICTEDENGKEEIFVFPRSVHHDAFAQQLEAIKNQTYGDWRRIHRIPVSAGFVDAKNVCYGESETLGLSSRKIDTEILKKQLV